MSDERKDPQQGYVDSLHNQLETARATRAHDKLKIKALEKSLADALVALKLGGHLRPDGNACSYIATTTCNKCGTMPPHAGAYFAAARYRKALEELKDAAATYREAADKPCGDQALDTVRLAFIEAFNTIDAIATRALTEEERDDG